MSEPTQSRESFLRRDEPPACSLIDAAGPRPALLVCDHASDRIPACLGDMGVSPEDQASHIGVDIGAAAVVRHLSRRLALPAVLCNYSRLVVDCNRRLTDPTAFPELSHGRPVPANAGLTREDRQRRADAIYWPYHHTIRDRIAALGQGGLAPALIAIHSFSPRIGSHERPWHFGILWDRDPRIPKPLMATLSADPAVNVGDNEPYSGRHPSDFTIDHHAEANGLPHVSIEIRQDLITTPDGVTAWADRLAEALNPILEDRALYRYWPGG